ncbi:hypothetical protein J3Q64DRAFT_1482269 [Phycomyces blakesleeanus]
MSSSFDPFFILVVYETASPAARATFYSDLQSFAILNNPIIQDRLFILGDFNFSFLKPTSLCTAPLSWQHYLGSYFVNCHTSLDPTLLPIFSRSSSTTTIDCMFAAYSMSLSIVNHDIQFISPLWTDHALLQTTICLGTSDKRRGLGVLTLLLPQTPTFFLLSIPLSIASFLSFPIMIHNASRKSSKLLRLGPPRNLVDAILHIGEKKLLKSLQSKWSQFLQSKPILAVRLLLLPKYDQQIAAIQQELVNATSLRAGLRWV